MAEPTEGDTPRIFETTMAFPTTSCYREPELRAAIETDLRGRLLVSLREHGVDSPPEITVTWLRWTRRPDPGAEEPKLEPITDDMTFAERDLVICEVTAIA